jgi:hypothetical protein
LKEGLFTIFAGVQQRVDYDKKNIFSNVLKWLCFGGARLAMRCRKGCVEWNEALDEDWLWLWFW